MCFSPFWIILENPTIVVITHLFFSIFVLAYSVDNGTCDKHAWIKIKKQKGQWILRGFFGVMQSKWESSIGRFSQSGDHPSIGRFSQSGDHPSIGRFSQSGDHPSIGRFSQRGDHPSIGRFSQSGDHPSIGRSSQSGDHPSIGRSSQSGDHPSIVIEILKHELIFIIFISFLMEFCQSKKGWKGMALDQWLK